MEGIPDHGRGFGIRGGLRSLPTQTNPVLGCCDWDVFAHCRISQDRAFAIVWAPPETLGKAN